MPLHLLGKKSWNVYGSDNVARVRRDEAEARAREEAEEQAMQDADAARRIALLRGQDPLPLDPLPPQRADAASPVAPRPSLEHGLPRKRRRLRGEDDTARDIRYAREDAAAGERAREVLSKGKDDGDAPLIDHAGHVQLIPAPDEKAIRKAEKNAEAEAEKAKKRKREEDQYTMRFSNAAGFDNGMARPWYAQSASTDAVLANQKSKASSDSHSNALVLPHVQDKDAWGNEDPLRKERERSRISSNDPFAAMQQAQRQLKQSERDKGRWREERQAETEELKRAEKRERRHERKHRRHADDEDSVEDFNLDVIDSRNGEKRDGHRRHHHHRHYRHRSREPSRSQDKQGTSRHRLSRA